MTLLLLPEPADDELEARHMPTMNSYDSFRVRLGTMVANFEADQARTCLPWGQTIGPSVKPRSRKLTHSYGTLLDQV